jgi:methyl-accepting chemotaxis protein
MEWNSQTILVIFVALTGLAVVMQAFVLVGILAALRKAANQSVAMAEDLRSNVIPTVNSARALMERVGPLLEQISPQVLAVSTNLAEISKDLREESAEIRRASADVKERLNRQAVRLDHMLTNSLDKVEEISEMVETAITTPVRQVNGVVQAFRAAVDCYFGFEPKRQITHPSRDKDLFI